MNRCKAFLKPMVFIRYCHPAGRCYGQKAEKVIGRSGAYTVFSGIASSRVIIAPGLLSATEMVSDTLR